MKHIVIMIHEPGFIRECPFNTGFADSFYTGISQAATT
jgi:hypothetical protein